MDARTLLAWTPRRLPDGLAPAVAGLPVVEDVAEVIGGTAWLTGSSPAGFAIPVEVAAADPTAYARFVGPDVRSMLAEVERGAALLGRTSAGLRRSGPGGRIRFSTGDVPVAGVAADEEVGASEVFVSRETAAALGVSAPRHLLIGPANGVERSTIVGALEALLPAGTALHTATHWEAPFLRYGHESLAPALMKAAMGEFAARPHDDGSLEVDPAWAPKHIAAAPMPILGTVTCNRALAPQLAGALGDVADAGLSELVDPADYRGCYVPRFVGRNPAGSLSNHSWGAAVDLNASRNPFGQPPRMDPRVVAAFERWGFRWGAAGRSPTACTSNSSGSRTSERFRASCTTMGARMPNGDGPQTSGPHERDRRRAGLLAAAAVAVVALVTGGSWALLQTHSGSPRVAGAVSSAPTGPGSSPSAGGAAPASDTLLAWTPGQLPPGLGDRVARLPGVDRVLTVVGGNVWLTRSTTASGAVVDRPSGGFAIPLELGAADLQVLRSFLPAADLPLLPALARGEAVLGATSARLRRLGAGGDLQLGSHHLRVAGVVPDADIGAHELFVSVETARALGITIPRYLLIDPAPGAPRDRIFAGIGALLPSGTPLRTRGPGETPFLRQGDAVLAPVMEKAAAGEFAARPLSNGFLQIDPAWVSANIETAAVPILGQVRCNRRVVPAIRAVLAELVRRGLSRLVDPVHYGGCFVPRFIGHDPTGTISHHSWGTAIDLNVSANPFGALPHQDPRLVAIFEANGFTWGGDWLVPDGMHFELKTPPSPSPSSLPSPSP